MSFEKEVGSKDSQGRSIGVAGRVVKISTGIIISAVFITLIFSRVDLGQLKERLSSMDMGVVPGLLISLAGMFMLKAIRWQYLMARIKKIAFIRVLNVTIIGFAANIVLPLRTGDLVRAHLLGKNEGITTTAVIATVALDRISEVISLLTVSIGVLVMAPVPAWMHKALLMLAAGVGLFIVFIAALRFPPRMIRRWWEFLRMLLPKRLESQIGEAIQQIRSGLEAGTGKVRLINSYILALVEYVFCGLLIYFSLKGVGIELSVITVMSALIATSLSVLIPAAPGNIGVFEFAAMGVLELYHIEKTTALSGAIILHAISILPACLVGLVLTIREWIYSRESLLKRMNDH